MSDTDAKHTYAYWEATMKGWTRDQLLNASLDASITHAQRATAKKMLRAESDASTSSGKPIADEAYEQVANRTEGVPKGGNDIQINLGAVINISTAELLDKMNDYLRNGRGAFEITPAGAGQTVPAQLPARGS